VSEYNPNYKGHRFHRGYRKKNSKRHKSIRYVLNNASTSKITSRCTYNGTCDIPMAAWYKRNLFV